MTKKIKLFDPVVDGTEKNLLNKVLQSKFWASGSGEGNVSIFEKKFQKYVSSKSCVSVNSGTAALHLALSIPNIKNKEVILPSLSFVSTAHAILYNGARPIFADIDPITLCLDVDDVKQKITKRTAVILPVHFGGTVANLSTLKKISQNSKCMLIEDAAHACGAQFKNKKIGNVGDITCFSFHPVKNLAMPSGGLISINHTNYKQITDILKTRRWCGITNRIDSNYDIKEIGWNFYMNEFSAVIGLSQLKKLDKLNMIRKNTAKKYYQHINVEQKMLFDKNSVYHFYWILVKNRSKFRKNLQKSGIETGIHYKPIHKMTFYKSKLKLPITEKVGKEIVTLPTHPNLSENDVERIITQVNRFLD